jgi:hypothetical protein
MLFPPHRRFALLAFAGLVFTSWAARAPADTPFDISPLGTQKVLVMLMEYPLNDACPNENETCNVDPIWYEQNVLPPRHTPEEWSALLNSVATRWWSQATYGQGNWEFTVLRHPYTQDGWWPAAHSFQDYKLNDSIWGPTKTSPPNGVHMVPDSVQSVVNTICGNIFNPELLAACGQLSQYHHLIVMPNFRSFGDTTVTGPFQIATLPTGPFVVSVTSANEDQNDQTVAAIMHELGHQVAEQSHYGDCSNYITFTSFNPTLPGGKIECITDWDVMGGSPKFSDFSAYSKVSRGIFDLSGVPSFDIISGSPFVQTYTLNPVEVPPTPANPDAIRLSTADLSWPQMSGYFVECRAQIGNDGPNPFPEVAGPVASIPQSGVLITNVHEFSTSDIPTVPAYHVERTLNPDPTKNDGDISNAALQPGQTFTDRILGVTVRFNSFVQLPGGGSACNVSVAHDRVLLPLAQRSISFAGNFKNGIEGQQVGLAQANGTGSIAPDIAFNTILAATSTVSSAVPLIAPWAGHDNPLSVRVHNRSTGPIDSVKLAVSVHQPALITDTCAMDMDSTAAGHQSARMQTVNIQTQTTQPGVISAVLSHIPAAGSAVANLDWRATADQSVEVDVAASGPANRISARSRAAFQFHSPQYGGQGMTSTFRIARAAMCSGPQNYFIKPAVSLADWEVQISSNSVTLNPGEQVDVSVHVMPIHTVPGQSAQIPITVLAPMQMLLDTSNIDPRTPSIIYPGLHLMPVGAMSILARITNGPGVVTLGCSTDGSHSKQDCACSDDGLNIAGAVNPATSGTPVTVEYRSPNGKVFSHVVQTDQSGRYRDSVGQKERGTDVSDKGDWVVQTRWSGGQFNDPTESPSVTFHVRDSHRH